MDLYKVSEDFMRGYKISPRKIDLIPSDVDMPIVEDFYKNQLKDLISDCQTYCWVPGSSSIYILWDIIVRSYWYNSNLDWRQVFKDEERITSYLLLDKTPYSSFKYLFNKTGICKQYNWLALIYWEYAINNNLIDDSKHIQAINKIPKHIETLDDIFSKHNVIYKKQVLSTLQLLVNNLENNSEYLSLTDTDGIYGMCLDNLEGVYNYVKYTDTFSSEYLKVIANYIYETLKGFVYFDFNVKLIDFAFIDNQKPYKFLSKIGKNYWKTSPKLISSIIEKCPVSIKFSNNPTIERIFVILMLQLLWLTSQKTLHFDKFINNFQK